MSKLHHCRFSTIVTTFVFIGLCVATVSAQSDYLLSPYFDDMRDLIPSIVKIEEYSQSGGTKSWGTGVVLDLLPGSDSMIIVTNRHVLVNRDSLLLCFNITRFNDSTATLQKYRHKLLIRKEYGKSCFWPTVNDSDIAIVICADCRKNGVNGIEKEYFAHFSQFRYNAPIEFYGYPNYQTYGLNKSWTSFPIARRGSIAFAVTEEYASGDLSVHLYPKMMLIDGTSLSGNSGGPIFIQEFTGTLGRGPEIIRLFAGIISAHFSDFSVSKVEDSVFIRLADSVAGALNSSLPLSDSLSIALIELTRRIVHKENANLAIGISSDFIIEYFKSIYRSGL